MYIHQIEFQENNPKNYQERYLKVESWQVFVDCFLNGVECKPNIKAYKNFKTMFIKQGLLCGSYILERLEYKIIHMSKEIEYGDIPFDTYIDEVKVVNKYNK